MNITLLGFTVPDFCINNILKTDPNMPIQTHKFAWAIVNALVLNNVKVQCVSSEPVSNYPLYKKVFFKGNYHSYNGVDISTIPFVNLIFLKHVTRLISSFFTLFNLKSHQLETIIVHGVHTPFLLSSFIMKKFFSSKVIVILTDPPSVLNQHDNLLSKSLKAVDKKVIKFLLSKMDASIVVSEFLSQDFMPHKPSLVLEGIVSIKSGKSICAADSHTFVLAYTGGLYEKYGVKALLDAIVELNHLNIKLKIFGKGELEPLIIQLSEKYSVIEYFGFVRPDLLNEYLSDVSLLINPRPINFDFVKYSFPSKLLEYMATGICVLTSRLPTIPKEYNSFLFFLEQTNSDGIKSMITKLYNYDKAVLRDVGIEACKFVSEEKSSSSQGKRLVNFLQGI
jgi:glycosyltransferase involved in cell wall biosynthesis